MMSIELIMKREHRLKRVVKWVVRELGNSRLRTPVMRRFLFNMFNIKNRKNISDARGLLQSHWRTNMLIGNRKWNFLRIMRNKTV